MGMWASGSEYVRRRLGIGGTAGGAVPTPVAEELGATSDNPRGP
jgi:hypothetical protein